MNIAFLSSADPSDKRAWSGIHYYMAKSLQKHSGEIIFICPTYASSQQSQGRTVRRKLRYIIKRYFTSTPFFTLGRKYFVSDYRVFVAKRFVKEATRQLARQAFDVIIAPASTTEIAFLDTDIPIVLVEDATFATLKDYYPQYSRLPKRAIRQMDTLYQHAVQKAAMLLYTSSWAANSAIDDYHADPHAVHIVPFGANLDHSPASAVVQQRRRSDRCRLLFMGFDWERKGGDIAFETLLELEKLGIQAELTVCGCLPPKKVAHEHLRCIPYLDKNDAKQYEMLEELYLTSDFLLLPTRSECFGLVFCEANAFGLPVITTKTGGIPEIVRNGENGFMLPLDASGSLYAQVIADIYQNDELYDQMVIASRRIYEERLNWDTWGMTIKNLLADVLSEKAPQNTLENNVSV